MKATVEMCQMLKAENTKLKQDKQELENKLDRLEKYKNAWEDMYKWFSQRNSKYDTPKSLEIENFVSAFMQELEEKHGIEVNRDVKN